MSSSEPSDFKLDAPAEFTAKMTSIYAQFKEIEKKKHDTTKEAQVSSNESPIQKDEPKVLRDDEFAIPKSKLQLDQRNHHFLPSSSEVAHCKPPFEFTRPRLPPMPKVKIPDHKRHPENWTKYSLASVDESELSDGANTAAALSYLKQQERRSQGQALWDEDAQLLDLRAKVMFNGNRKNNDRLRSRFLIDNSTRDDDGKNSGNQSLSADGQPVAEFSDEATRSVFSDGIQTQAESRFKGQARVALSHLQEEDDDNDDDDDDQDDDQDEEGNDDKDGHDDVVMNTDEEDDATGLEKTSNTVRSEAATLEDGSNSSNRDDMPKLKKFKRAKVMRSEIKDDEDTVANRGEKS